MSTLLLLPIRSLRTTRVGLKFENPPVYLNSSPVSSVDGADQFWKVDIVSISCLFRMPNSDPLSVYHCYFIIQCAKLILVLRGPGYSISVINTIFFVFITKIPNRRTGI